MPDITVDQIKGFSLFMIKAVLDGAEMKSSISQRSTSGADESIRGALGFKS